MAKKQDSEIIGTIDPNKIKTEDPLQMMIINGVTKSSVYPDRKKEKNKKKCREKVRNYED